MKEIPLPTDKKDIETYLLRKTSTTLLGTDLVPSDCHDEERAMMTEDQAWYFVPCEGDFVMSERTILEGKPRPTNKLRWRVEITKYFPGGRMEPDEYDLAEVGERRNSLSQAIEEAAILAAKFKINNILEGLHWEAESLKEKLGYFEH